MVCDSRIVFKGTLSRHFSPIFMIVLATIWFANLLQVVILYKQFANWLKLVILPTIWFTQLVQVCSLVYSMICPIGSSLFSYLQFGLPIAQVCSLVCTMMSFSSCLQSGLPNGLTFVPLSIKWLVFQHVYNMVWPIGSSLSSCLQYSLSKGSSLSSCLQYGLSNLLKFVLLSTKI